MKGSKKTGSLGSPMGQTLEKKQRNCPIEAVYGTKICGKSRYRPKGSHWNNLGIPVNILMGSLRGETMSTQLNSFYVIQK